MKVVFHLSLVSEHAFNFIEQIKIENALNLSGTESEM